MTTIRPTSTYRPLAWAVLALLPVAAIAQAEDNGYGYYRILEGEAIRYGVTDEERKVSENEPLLEGDRVRVESGSRLEVVLPDFSRMRMDQYTDVDFERLRARDDRAEDFRIRLFEGDVQLTVTGVPEEFLVSLDVADVYLLEGGSYRITGGTDYASVLVREGYAEILTERGSAVARQGEEVVVEGARDPRVWVQDAGRPDALERWADANERSAQRSSRYVDQDLGYVAADLEDNGEWVQVGGSYAWRPLARYGWKRPYHTGYWYDTPYGIHWVSQHRWGWLTAHYGYWDFDIHFGWVWYPGVSYSPAWVHWYWGPSYVGWIPSGYYYRHYGHYGYNYYGYVGHGWYGHGHGHDYWTFSRRGKFGHRRERFYYDGVEVVPRHGKGLEAGIITTDTRGLRRHNWNRIEEADRILTRNASRTRGGLTYRHPEDLPDAVGYVTRNARELPTEVGATKRLGVPPQRAAGGAGRVTRQTPAEGLVVPRTEIGGRGVGAQDRDRTAGNPAAGTRTGIETRRRAPTRTEDAPSTSASRRRVVLPGTPGVLGRGDSRPEADARRREPTDRRSAVGRSSREPTRREGWEIERREIPRQPARTSETRRREPRSSSDRSVSSERPGAHERPGRSYDRGDRRNSGPAVSRPATPTRRYDRPSSRRSSNVRARGSSSKSSGSKGSGGSSGGSGGKSTSSSSSSSRGSGSASRSRSGG